MTVGKNNPSFGFNQEGSAQELKPFWVYLLDPEGGVVGVSQLSGKDMAKSDGSPSEIMDVVGTWLHHSKALQLEKLEDDMYVKMMNLAVNYFLSSETGALMQEKMEQEKLQNVHGFVLFYQGGQGSKSLRTFALSDSQDKTLSREQCKRIAADVIIRDRVIHPEWFDCELREQGA